MPAINVNPTRQELTRLKTRLRTSIRGHKLLKDKRDELMKQFMDVVRENRALRKRVEEGLMRAHGSFTVASALMSTEMLEQALPLVAEVMSPGGVILCEHPKEEVLPETAGGFVRHKSYRYGKIMLTAYRPPEETPGGEGAPGA